MSETDKKENWKSKTNLSRTMKFVPDFCHRLSIGHGVRQICFGFPVLFFYLSQTFQCLSSLSCLYRQQQESHEAYGTADKVL